MTAGTLYLTECSITSSSLLNSVSGIGGVGGTIIMRDCLLTTTGTPSLISYSGSLTIRQCNLINTSGSTGVNPLVVLNPTVSTPCEISYSTLQYTSSVSAANKICVRVNGATGTTASLVNFVNNLFICEGATSGSGTYCIDKGVTGSATINYGNLLAGATAHSIDPSIVKTLYYSVP